MKKISVCLKGSDIIHTKEISEQDSGEIQNFLYDIYESHIANGNELKLKTWEDVCVEICELHDYEIYTSEFFIDMNYDDLVKNTVVIINDISSNR
jgi:hypothetical protein